MTFIEAAVAISGIDDPVERRAFGLSAFGKRYLRVEGLLGMDVADVRELLKRTDESW